MIGIIILFLFIIFCIYMYSFFIKLINRSPPQKRHSASDNNFYAACHEIELSRAKVNWENEKKFLNAKRESLNSEIESKLKECDNEKIRPFLEHLLKMESWNKESLEKKEWLFNNGNLRSLSEINESEWQKEKLEYYKSGQFKKEAVRTNIVAFFAPFLIVFSILMVAWWKHLWIFTIPIALVFALIASMIGMAVGHKINLDKADKYDIPANDPQVQYEKREQQIGAIATIAAAIHVGHHTKNAIKEVGNPDSWKEMK